MRSTAATALEEMEERSVTEMEDHDVAGRGVSGCINEARVIIRTPLARS